MADGAPHIGRLGISQATEVGWRIAILTCRYTIWGKYSKNVVGIPEDIFEGKSDLSGHKVPGGVVGSAWL